MLRYEAGGDEDDYVKKCMLCVALAKQDVILSHY